MTDPPIPEVDYTRTARRPDWAELPATVHALVDSLCGAAVAHADAPAGGGFTSGYAGVVGLVDGREVFVKAGGPANEHVLPAYRQEAAILPVLPAGVPAPTLLATGEVDSTEGTWRVLVTELIRGRMPGQPWTDGDLGAVHRACLRCAQLLTPAGSALPGLDLPRLADQMSENDEVTTRFARLAAGEVTATWGQPSWLVGRAADLAELTDRASEVLQGNTAGHADVRGDNLLIDDAGAAWLLDWNWLSVGPAWTDFVGVLPLARADGVDVDGWLARSELTRDVDPAAIDTWLAVVAAFMLHHAGNPDWPGAPDQLRVHQRRYARTFLDWLGARRGWA